MSSDSRVRNRISPIQQNSGSAVSVHDDDEPQIVTAIASPAGRELKSSMPIHATPASARPIHTPLPSSANSATISSERDRRAITHWCAAPRRRHARRRRPCHSATSSSTQRDRAGSACRAPSRAAGSTAASRRSPVETSLNCHDWNASRTLKHANSAASSTRDAQRPQLEPAARAAGRRSMSSVTRMCSPRFSVCGEREEARRRHAVAGVGVGARHVEVQQAAGDAGQHHRERADQEQRRQVRAAAS